MDPRHKVACWNARLSENLTPLDCVPANVRDFNGAISSVAVSDLNLADVYSDAQIVRHSRDHVSRNKHPIIFLQLQLEGDSVTRQEGRESVLHAGDFALLDTTRRYEILFNGANRMLVLSIPNHVLRRHIGSPESLVAIPMPGSYGANRLLSQLLSGFLGEHRRGLDELMSCRVSGVILDLIAAAYADVPNASVDRSAVGTAHRVRIMNYIRAHLNDQELTPARIAAACKITPRYLHYLFSDQGETVGRHILRRRLEECARALQSRGQRGRTVTAIAFDHGFNSPTHFGRAFRDKYNLSPREYRERASLEGAPPEREPRNTR